MSTASRVPGPTASVTDTPPETARYRDSGGTIVSPIGPGTLDGPRLAAREAEYGNRQREIEAVMDIDNAAFDRVRSLERYMIDRAETFVADVVGAIEGAGPRRARRPGLIDVAEEVVTGLNALVTELERGASAGDLAERFIALQNEAKHAALPKLARAIQEVDGHIPKMEDPYGEVQRIIAKMPYSSFRPLIASARA